MKKLLAIAILWLTPMIAAGQTFPSEALQQVLIPGEDWKVVAQDLRSTDGPAANAKGEVFFNDGRSGKVMKIGPDGAVSDFVANTHRGAGQAFGVDGRLYAAADATDQIIAYDADAKASIIADNLHGNDLTISANGNMYVTQSPVKAGEIGKIWLVTPAGEKKLVDPAFSFPNGVALSPDQRVLYVGDYRSHWVYSYSIQPDGTLGPKREFCDLYMPATAKDSAADGMRMDNDGRLYVTTRSGIQVCDRAGRLIGIISVPAARVTNLSFGGADFDVIYATCGDKILARKVQVRGVKPFEAPLKK